MVIDRLVIREGIEQRLADSLETALELGEGVVFVQIIDGEELMFSQNFACVECGISLPEIAPRMFLLTVHSVRVLLVVDWATIWSLILSW